MTVRRHSEFTHAKFAGQSNTVVWVEEAISTQQATKARLPDKELACRSICARSDTQCRIWRETVDVFRVLTTLLVAEH